MATKYNKKAVLLYLCKQIGKGIPVTRTEAETTGTIATIVDSNKLFGKGTKFLTEAAEGAYVYYGTKQVGQISKVVNNNEIDMVLATPAAEVLAVSKVSTAKATAVGTVVPVSKTITTLTTSSTATITAGATFSKGDVIVSLANQYVGTVAAAVANTDTSITFTENAKVALVADTTGTSFKKVTAGVDFNIGMGNANAVAAYTLNASTEISVENFQYVGDELNRDEVTSETDRYFKADFECHMPALGELNLGTVFTSIVNAVVINTDATITRASGNFTTDGVVAGTKLFTSGATASATPLAFIGTVKEISTDGSFLLLVSNPEANSDYICFNTVVTPTPTIAQIPRRELFEMLGLHPTIGAGFVKFSNDIAGDDFLEVEYHMASADNLTTVKVRRMTDVVGTVDLNLDAIGKRMKMKLSLMGAYSGIFAGTARIPYYGVQKQYLADNVNADKVNKNIIKVALVPYTAKSAVIFGTTLLAIGDTVSLGGLTFTAGGDVTRAQLVDLWENLPNGTVAADLPTTLGTWAGTLTGYSTFVNGISVMSILVQTTSATANIFSTPFTGTALAVIESTVNAMESPVPALPKVSNVCIDKLDITNFAGFAFNRYMMSCGTGWSKMAVQGELSINILEDAAGVTYEPENFVGKDHRFYLSWGSSANNTLVVLDVSKATLQAPTSGEIADYKGQALKFRITGTCSIQLS